MTAETAHNASSIERQQFTLAVLPGDGTGPSVIAQALKVLAEVEASRPVDFKLREGLIGAAALKQCGVSLPDETLALCRSSDAVLLGAVGDPDWDLRADADEQPAVALLRLRKKLDLYANVRPVRLSPSMSSLSYLTSRALAGGVDLLIVREMSGGLFFGEPRGVRQSGPPWNEEEAYDSMTFRRSQVERVGRVAFSFAQQRRRHLTSVDQANVLTSSRLWRESMESLASDYPAVRLEHLYIDNCANALVRQPFEFDVLVTDGLFGGILSDEAAGIVGSIGMLPSASVGDGRIGLFEPVHGSVPKHTGLDRVNPVAAIRSLALLFQMGFGLRAEAEIIEEAISQVIGTGLRTYDIALPSEGIIGTEAMGDAIAQQTSRLLQERSFDRQTAID